MKRQGRRWALMKSKAVRTDKKRNSEEESTSLLKLVGGAMSLTSESWTAAKSAMLFCKSRMLRKKSFDVSEAGLMVLGGASAGP